MTSSSDLIKTKSLGCTEPQKMPPTVVLRTTCCLSSTETCTSLTLANSSQQAINYQKRISKKNQENFLRAGLTTLWYIHYYFKKQTNIGLDVGIIDCPNWVFLYKSQSVGIVWLIDWVNVWLFFFFVFCFKCLKQSCHSSWCVKIR